MDVDMERLAAAAKDAIKVMKSKPIRDVVTHSAEHALARAMLTQLITNMIVQVEVEDLVATQLPYGARPEHGCLKNLKAGERLGQGFYGQVFQLSNNRAVKVIRLSGGRGRSAREAFETELGMMRRAADIGVSPKVHDGYVCCSKFETCYGIIIMDAVKGVLLRDWIKQKHKASVVDAVRAALRIAIDKLHKNGIYHNDMHAGNIIIGRGRAVSIIDYGFATSGPHCEVRPGKKHVDFDVLSDIDRIQGSTDYTRNRWLNDDAVIDAVVKRLLESGVVKINAA